jgi:SNF2 family DNA or RNA helicase
LLRRLKSEVARDLPEIVESDRIVELSNTQEQLYRGVLEERGTRELVEQVQRGEQKKHGISILQVLSKLRHVCNDPTLVRGGAVDAAESAKLMALAELLEEVKEGGHRALIFSQFTRVLDILEERLALGRYKYLRLDGGTPNDQRQPLVDQFNRDSSYDCFLISTKAGGVGLNLTGADTVIFFDHDWNPQNDEQARARAHRIGQTRTVTVYRLVTKGTIEERMLSIQDRKKRLAEALVTETPQGFLNISREELLSLFEYQKSSQ